MKNFTNSFKNFLVSNCCIWVVIFFLVDEMTEKLLSKYYHKIFFLRQTTQDQCTLSWLSSLNTAVAIIVRNLLWSFIRQGILCLVSLDLSMHKLTEKMGNFHNHKDVLILVLRVEPAVSSTILKFPHIFPASLQAKTVGISKFQLKRKYLYHLKNKQ